MKFCDWNFNQVIHKLCNSYSNTVNIFKSVIRQQKYGNKDDITTGFEMAFLMRFCALGLFGNMWWHTVNLTQFWFHFAADVATKCRHELGIRVAALL